MSFQSPSKMTGTGVELKGRLRFFLLLKSCKIAKINKSKLINL